MPWLGMWFSRPVSYTAPCSFVVGENWCASKISSDFSWRLTEFCQLSIFSRCSHSDNTATYFSDTLREMYCYYDKSERARSQFNRLVGKQRVSHSTDLIKLWLTTAFFTALSLNPLVYYLTLKKSALTRKRAIYGSTSSTMEPTSSLTGCICIRPPLQGIILETIIGHQLWNKLDAGRTQTDAGVRLMAEDKNAFNIFFPKN